MNKPPMRPMVNTDPYTITVTRREHEELKARVEFLENFTTEMVGTQNHMAHALVALQERTGGPLKGQSADESVERAAATEDAEQSFSAVADRFGRLEVGEHTQAKQVVLDGTEIAINAQIHTIRKPRGRYIPGSGWEA